MKNEVITQAEMQLTDFEEQTKSSLQKAIFSDEKIEKIINVDPETREIINSEIDNKMHELKENIVVNPEALYHHINAELALDDDMSDNELKKSAYEYLLSKTKSKLLKKIFKHKITEIKKEI